MPPRVCPAPLPSGASRPTLPGGPHQGLCSSHEGSGVTGGAPRPPPHPDAEPFGSAHFQPPLVQSGNSEPKWHQVTLWGACAAAGVGREPPWAPQQPPEGPALSPPHPHPPIRPGPAPLPDSCQLQGAWPETGAAGNEAALPPLGA